MRNPPQNQETPQQSQKKSPKSNPVFVGVDFGVGESTVLLKIEAGEHLNPFSFIYIGNDGKAYMSDPSK